MATVVRQIGNTKITFSSQSVFITLTAEERQAWFEKQYADGNPVAVNLVNTVFDIRRGLARVKG